MDFKKTQLQSEVAKIFEWDKWAKEIPFINFHKDWLVKAIPPFGGAVIRYYIKHKNKPDSHVSIYLDCYDNLGFMNEPYWELYPNKEGDCDRFLMNDVDGLLKGIKKALKAQRSCK